MAILRSRYHGPWAASKRAAVVPTFMAPPRPKELILPILVVRQKPRSPEPLTKAQWRLTTGSKTISARFLSVQIDGEAKGLVEFSPPAVRLEVREGGECLSRPVASSYGFQEATSSAKLKMDQGNPDRVRPNTVTLMLEKLPSSRQVDLYLIDVAERERAGPRWPDCPFHWQPSEASAMDALDTKVSQVLAGRVVHKDLVRKVKPGAPVPVYVA